MLLPPQNKIHLPLDPFVFLISTNNFIKFIFQAIREEGIEDMQTFLL
jgi:hypothetical protein